jgi:hypothetical protein
MKKHYVVTIAAAIVCSFSVGVYAYCKAPVSYLSLDINPSVELGINAFGKVVSVSAYNEDGKTILEGQDVINSDVEDAVSTLVTSAAEEGFIADDGSTVIAVTSETDNEKAGEDLETAAEDGANAAIEESGETAEVLKENVALARRDEARALGITPGKLNLIQKLQALDPAITVDEYKDAKVTEIQKKFVELKNGAKTGNKDEEINKVADENTSEAVENNTETLTVPSKKDNKASIKVKTSSHKNTAKSNKKGKNY